MNNCAVVLSPTKRMLRLGTSRSSDWHTALGSAECGVHFKSCSRWVRQAYLSNGRPLKADRTPIPVQKDVLSAYGGRAVRDTHRGLSQPSGISARRASTWLAIITCDHRDFIIVSSAFICVVAVNAPCGPILLLLHPPTQGLRDA
eukprot:3524775-Prymnesium_polylepis.3